MKPPAPRPCESCPYRRDVLSGVWHSEEYGRLTLYDKPTGDQPMGVFRCHQHDSADDDARVCAGWVGCHGQELLGLRIAVADGRLPATVMDYTTTVPLFGSGLEAAQHGMREISSPTPKAVEMGRKITTNRKDIEL